MVGCEAAVLPFVVRVFRLQNEAERHVQRLKLDVIRHVRAPPSLLYMQFPTFVACTDHSSLTRYQTSINKTNLLDHGTMAPRYVKSAILAIPPTM